MCLKLKVIPVLCCKSGYLLVSVFSTCMNEIFPLRWIKLVLMLEFKIMLGYETMRWVMLMFCEPYWVAVWLGSGVWVNLHTIRSGKILTKFIVTVLFCVDEIHK